MRTFLLIAALCAAPLAHAADKLIFACTNAQGKQVRVTERGGKYRYQFGRPGRPELVFEDSKQAAIARSPLFDGVGSYLWQQLVLQNGGYRYALFSSMYRNSDDHPVHYGVTVRKLEDGEALYINEIRCSGKYKITQNFPDEVLF